MNRHKVLSRSSVSVMPSQNLPASCSARLFSPRCWHTFRFCCVAISCLERSTRILAPASVIAGRIAEVTDLLQLHLWRWEPRGAPLSMWPPHSPGRRLLQACPKASLVQPSGFSIRGLGQPRVQIRCKTVGVWILLSIANQVPWPYPGRRLIRRFQRSWGLITDWHQDMHRGRENLWPVSPSIS